MSAGGGAASGVGDRRRRLFGTVVSGVLVLIAVLLVLTGSDGGDDSQVLDTSPHFVEASELTALEGSLGHAIYWLGERPPDRIELTEEADGSVYLRYLPPGTAAGDPRADFLTVGTYPVVEAQVAVRRAAAGAGASIGRVGDGGIVLANPASEGSVYLAYPDSDLQIEVYDPAPGRAMRLVRAGSVRPVW